ncbi:MAG: hypothetical protein K2K81_02790 [Muribaculaceae bacterium]|nr:hypothetical protein [Muribaculaceae bacterium]MDE6682172.1 hypothetical protein [Muribaculaceae bacterium]
MENNFSKKFLVSANEANPEGELAVHILVSDLIVVATKAALELGIGNPTMAHLNAGWVLSRLTIEMQSYPKVNTEYKIITWVESWNRHFSVRDFEIQDSDGKTVGYARSIWMVLNTVTHENFGLSHLSLPEGAVSDRPCPIARQEKHIEILRHDADEIPSSALRANSEERLYTFQYNDIDFYRHVNTVRYVSLLLNSYTLDEFDRSFLSRLELSFLHEGNFGETVEIRRFNHSQNLSSFSLYSQKKEMPILFARIQLKERQ